LRRNQSANDKEDKSIAERVDNRDSLVRPNRLIDSYRPSYANNQPPNQPLYSTGQRGHVIQPNSRATTPFPQNIPRGPKKPKVLDTRSEEPSGGRTPHHGERQPYNQTNAGQPYHQTNARQHSWSQSSVHSGPRVQTTKKVTTLVPATLSEHEPCGYIQASRPNQTLGGGRTPGYVIDTRFCGAETPRPNQQQRGNQAYRERIDRQRPLARPGATGGIHYRFKDEKEDDNGLFVSP